VLPGRGMHFLAAVGASRLRCSTKDSPRSRPVTRTNLFRGALAAVTLALAVASDVALAEASHHQGAGAGQVANAAAAGQLRSFAGAPQADPRREWQLTLFPSYLRATRAFDDDGMAASMPVGTRVENYTLNAYAERRLGDQWAVSALTGWQELRLREAGTSRSVSSLADSFLSVRHSDATSWGALSAIATVKVPGTYVESALTSAKQVDAQLEVLASVQLLRWLGVVAGAGYRARFGDVQDEVTATALVPVRIGERFTVTPSVIAATPVGLGAVAKNSVLAGTSAAWRALGPLDVTAAYYRTVYGRNVVQADVVTLGAGARF
jgi:hypothetical protein